MAWLLTHLGSFAEARVLCEQERPPGEEVKMDQLLGAIVLGFAHLGLKRHAAALRAFEEVTAQSTLIARFSRCPFGWDLASTGWPRDSPVRPTTSCKSCVDSGRRRAK